VSVGAIERGIAVVGVEGVGVLLLLLLMVALLLLPLLMLLRVEGMGIRDIDSVERRTEEERAEIFYTRDQVIRNSILPKNR